MSQTKPFREMHFEVALSFPGEKRDYVEQVAEELAHLITRESVFYDNWYQPHLAGLNLDLLLQDVYHKRSRLLVVFICEEYERKEWCSVVEWRAIRDLIKNRREEDIMFVRFDDATVPGVFSIDGSMDARKETPTSIAKAIVERAGVKTSLPTSAIKGDESFLNGPFGHKPYIICALPRGVLSIDDACPSADPTWSMTAYYYHFKEGWRYGTHYHPSYWNAWQEPKRLDHQCSKVQIPEADWPYSHWPFFLMTQLGEAKSVDEAISLVASHCGSESFAKFYFETEQPDPSLFNNLFQALKRTGNLRDLRQEIVTWKNKPQMRWGDTDQFAFSLAYRVLTELSVQMSTSSPAYSMLEGLLQQREHKDTTAFWKWLELVDVALIDSIDIIAKQGART